VRKKLGKISGNQKPRCVIIAGPNGAGKTTFAREYLVHEGRIIHFVNADLIAAGISPLKPELALVTSGKLLLKEVDRLVAERRDFAFESTLSGRAYLSKIKDWKIAGYRIEIIFLKLTSPKLSIKRITDRVRQGGHFIPSADVKRRFKRGWDNFIRLYRPLADEWAVYDNSGETFILIEEGP